MSKYKIYYNESNCKIPNFTLNLVNNNLAEYIKNMEEPIISVNNDYVTMIFEPIPQTIASQLIQERKLKFQVVRHKANSSHTKNVIFPYSFKFSKYINPSEIQNPKWGISIPNNGSNNLKIVTNPTLSELTSGTLTRDMSDLFRNIKLHKCQTYTETSPWIAEFYFGFIYWENWSKPPRIFKMGYYSREE